jgi:hypothetical protein
MAPTESSPDLGDFATLAPEIRLLIWEYLFPRGIYASSVVRTEATDLSMLRTSQRLYNEISHYLYSNLIQKVEVSPRFSRNEWMVIKIKSKKLRAKWIWKDEVDVRHRGFENFPYHKVDLIINIYAPDPKDPGQLILLWQKINALAKIIGHQSSLKSLNIKLRKSRASDWLKSEHLNHSIDHPDGSYPDHVIVLMPLCRLLNLSISRITLHSQSLCDAVVKCDRNLIKNDSQLICHFIPGSKQEYIDDTRHSDNIERRLMDTMFLLDAKLDYLPGKTANMLRLERFSKWFKDGETGYPGDSEYDENFKFALREYPEIVYKYDSELSDLFQRHKLLINLYLDQRKNPKVLHYYTWNQMTWYKAYPNGIEPFHHYYGRTTPPTFIYYGHLTYRRYLKETKLFSDFDDSILEWSSWRRREIWSKIPSSEISSLKISSARSFRLYLLSYTAYLDIIGHSYTIKYEYDSDCKDGYESDRSWDL